MAVDPATFRDVAEAVRSGVAVATVPPAAAPRGATVDAGVESRSPPVVSVAVDRDSPVHALLRRSAAEDFCVTVLADDQAHLARYFAGVSDLSESPFTAEPVRTAETGAPYFAAALAYADCRVERTTSAGERAVYAGEVVDAGVLDSSAAPLTDGRSEWQATP